MTAPRKVVSGYQVHIFDQYINGSWRLHSHLSTREKRGFRPGAILSMSSTPQTSNPTLANLHTALFFVSPVPVGICVFYQDWHRPLLYPPYPVIGLSRVAFQWLARLPLSLAAAPKRDSSPHRSPRANQSFPRLSPEAVMAGEGKKEDTKERAR